jgi:hypothetical protein
MLRIAGPPPRESLVGESPTEELVKGPELLGYAYISQLVFSQCVLQDRLFLFVPQGRLGRGDVVGRPTDITGIESES